MTQRAAKFLLSCIIGCGSAHALILSGKGNTENLSDPSTGVPWDAVGSLTNGDGTVIGGTGIHLGNGYILTANHVDPFDLVTFDGTTFYNDGTAPVQVAAGVDMKIFHLSAVPPVSAVTIYTGSDELLNPATIVAFGRGREGTGSSGTTVTWDDDNGSVAKRWGTNQPNATYAAITYGYDILGTTLNSAAGADEAALVLLDSGSGMFQQISGTWYLTGLATSVTTTDSSTFGTDITTAPGTPRSGLVGDSNYFVRISSYNTQIANIIPEPSAGAWLIVLLPFGFRRSR